jgi:hypothetical protein
VAAGLGVLGLTRRAEAGGQYGNPNVVKDHLQDIKDLACTLADYVEGMEGPLTVPAHLAWVEANILAMAADGQKMLNIPSSLLFSPPSAWLYWMPIDASGMNLGEVAAAACHAACEALERWCEYMEPGGNPNDAERAAEALWQVQMLYCHLFDVAGII